MAGLAVLLWPPRSRFATRMRVKRRAGDECRQGYVRVELYAVVSLIAGEVLEVFTARAEADALVVTWGRDEPDEAGALEVVELVIDCSLN
jgi:hypothetical protein